MSGAGEIEWRRDRVVALTLEGLSAREIADGLGTCERTVVRDRTARGVVVPQRECQGGRYKSGGCRCGLCRQRNTELVGMSRQRRIERGAVPPKHGASGYRNYGCRCAVCTAGNSARCREYKESRQRVSAVAS